LPITIPGKDRLINYRAFQGSQERKLGLPGKGLQRRKWAETLLGIGGTQGNLSSEKSLILTQREDMAWIG
jgi:hypothetical protein